MLNAKIKPKIKNKTADKIFILCMIILPLMHFVVFSIYINLSSFVLAFRDIDYATNKEIFVGLQNFQRFFTEFREGKIWSRAIVNSLLYFPICSVLMLPLSIVAGYFLYRKIRLNGFFKIVFFLPSIISIVVLAIVFRNMFDSSVGPINFILEKLFKIPKENIPAWLVDPKYAMGTLYIYAIWAGIGYNVVLLFGAMSRVPMEIVESARMDGIGITREIFQIFVPITWPTISTLVVFGAMTIFTQFLHPMVLTPGAVGETYTLAYIIVTKVNQGQVYYSAALGLMLAAVAVPIVQFVKWVCGKIYDVVEV